MPREYFTCDYDEALRKTLHGHVNELTLENQKLKSKVEELRREAAEANRNLDMYANAWARELKYTYPKTHLIDELVLTTRRYVDLVQHPCCNNPEYCSNANCNRLLRYRLKID